MKNLEKNRGLAGWWPAIWAARGHVLRAWLWFVASLAVLIQVLVWARPFTDGELTAWIASASALVLRVLGNEASSQGTLVHSSIGTVEIIRECTGVYPTALYVSAVVAYPCAWRRKLLGICLGVVGVQVVNLVRVVSLMYIHRSYPAIYETSHLVVWQSLIVFFVVLLWIVWAIELSGSRRRHAA